jgi:hypothetical protein
MPNCRGGSRRQLALEECKLFGESKMANIDCGLSVADCWKFGGLPGSIPTAPTKPIMPGPPAGVSHHEAIDRSEKRRRIEQRRSFDALGSNASLRRTGPGRHSTDARAMSRMSRPARRSPITACKRVHPALEASRACLKPHWNEA